MSQTGTSPSTRRHLGAPRFETDRQRIIAGLRTRYTTETMNNIYAQWQRFVPHIGKIPGQVGRVAYGVCLNTSNGSEGIDYLTGVEVSSALGLPADFSVVAIPEQRFAVFSHGGHVAKLRETLDAIDKWLPNSGLKAVPGTAETPSFFERYTEEFDPRTGVGGIEVWVPISQ